MRVFAIFSLLILAGCTETSTMRMSSNELIINTSAEPICGGTGAAKVAQQMAAVETLRNGFDSYIIMAADQQNNVSVVQTPGSYTTYGHVNRYGNYNSFSANTYYTPGMTYTTGSHDQQLSIRMFRRGEPGSDRAIPARDVLGPKWASKVKTGVATCVDD